MKPNIAHEISFHLRANQEFGSLVQEVRTAYWKTFEINALEYGIGFSINFEECGAVIKAGNQGHLGSGMKLEGMNCILGRTLVI